VRRGFKSRPLRFWLPGLQLLDVESRPVRFGRLLLLAEDEDRGHHPEEEEDGHEHVPPEPATRVVRVGARNDHRRDQREGDEREAGQAESQLVSGRERREHGRNLPGGHYALSRSRASFRRRAARVTITPTAASTAIGPATI